LRRFSERNWFSSKLAVAVLPALVTGLLFAIARTKFEITHDLVHDWPNHAVYLPVFLLGFVAARSERFWISAERLRWWALVAAVIGYGGLLWLYRQDDRFMPEPVMLFVLRMWRCAYAWAAILTVLGFARRHFNRPSPTVAWLNRGVFCFYIVHQTAIILFGVALAPFKIGPVLEPLAILVLTVTTCLGIYALAERFGPAKLLFGLLPRKARSQSSPKFATAG
jgi:membrane-bound acyltransferase YfiQ involved in biofilm formation